MEPSPPMTFQWEGLSLLIECWRSETLGVLELFTQDCPLCSPASVPPCLLLGSSPQFFSKILFQSLLSNEVTLEVILKMSQNGGSMTVDSTLCRIGKSYLLFSFQIPSFRNDSIIPSILFYAVNYWHLTEDIKYGSISLLHSYCCLPCQGLF